jgi:hypothetical protein
MVSAPGIFQCDNCQRRFRWKAELAGRKVKCPCGQILTTPPCAPADEPLYDLVDTSENSADPIPNAQPSSANPTAHPLSYRSAPNVASPDHNLPDKVRDVQAPLALLTAGIFIQCVSALLESRHGIVPTSAFAALAWVGLELMLNTIVMVPAVFIAARFRAIDFGRFPTALLKLAAIAIAPGAFGTFIYFFIQVVPFSGLIAAALTFVFYFTLIGFLFDLDQSDTWYCVCVIFILNLAIYFASHFLLNI